MASFRDLAAPSSSVEPLLAVSPAEALEEGLEELSLLAEGDSLAECESSAEGEAEGEAEALADAESREATGAFTAGAQAARPSRLARLRDNTAIDFFTETFSFRQAS